MRLHGGSREAQRSKLTFTKKPSHADDDQEVELGRNLVAAFIATSHGIGLDYARKKYADEPLGEYWITLARMVIADMSNRQAEPERPTRIQ